MFWSGRPGLTSSDLLNRDIEYKSLRKVGMPILHRQKMRRNKSLMHIPLLGSKCGDKGKVAPMLHFQKP
jgi:hypothetical protein